MVERIGESISINEQDDKLSIIIDGRLPRAKESMLMAWLLLWAALGGYVMFELMTGSYDRDLRLSLMVYLALWAYFLFKIGRAFLWSRNGQELIILQEGALNIKKSIYGYGKAQSFHLANIENLAVSSTPRKSLAYQFESSFWVIGGERIDFDHMGQRMGIGRKIPDASAAKLVKKMKAFIKRSKG